MEEKSVFTEKQKFNQWWVWALLILIPVLLFIPLFNNWQSLQFGGSMGGQEWGLIAVFVVVLLVILLFYLLRLETRIDHQGVKVRFYPFQRKFRVISWGEIEEAHIRKYAPILEYGGWGLRFSHKGTAYNVAGNMGLQLVIRKEGKVNGKRLLIGTQKAWEMEDVLEQYQKV